MRFRTSLATALAAGLAMPAQAQKSADTLRVYWRDQINDIDPYYNSLRTGLIVAHHAWDTLIYRDPDGFAMKPLLATSWKWVDDTTLEFALRRGVTFHNGDPFTAADVAYTVGILTDPKSQLSVPSNYAWLAGAEVVDDHTVRLKLKQAFPAALEYVAFVMPIYPKAYRERVGREGYKKEPVGAGPYRINRVDGVSRRRRRDLSNVGFLRAGLGGARACLAHLGDRRLGWHPKFDQQACGDCPGAPEAAAAMQ
jgi:peptide/nickel transport system substrate-binding protein